MRNYAKICGSHTLEQNSFIAVTMKRRDYTIGLREVKKFLRPPSEIAALVGGVIYLAGNI